FAKPSKFTTVPFENQLNPWLLCVLLLDWHAAPQLFEPVQHDRDLRWRLRLPRLDHQEPPAVARHIEVGSRQERRLELTAEEHLRLARDEARLGADVHRHHLVAASVEQLTTVRVPGRLRTAIGRHLLPLSARPGYALTYTSLRPDSSDT